MKLLPPDKADAIVRDHVETTHYHDEKAGEPYEPVDLPEIDDPAGDEDSED